MHPELLATLHGLGIRTMAHMLLFLSSPIQKGRPRSFVEQVVDDAKTHP